LRSLRLTDRCDERFFAFWSAEKIFEKGRENRKKIRQRESEKAMSLP